MWRPLDKDEEKVYAAIQNARRISEAVGTGVKSLAASAVLDVLSVAYRFDRARSLMEVALDYARSKVKED